MRTKLEVARDKSRNRKRPMKHTENVRKLSKRGLDRMREVNQLVHDENQLADIPRPMTRDDCKGGIRPCPFVSCRWNLYLDVRDDTGNITYNFPDLEPWELPQSCALDIADRGGMTLEQVGEAMNLTRERVRQVEEIIMTKMRRRLPLVGIAA